MLNIEKKKNSIKTEGKLPWYRLCKELERTIN